MPRTNYCGHITDSYLTQEVTIKGWVHKRRDLGGLIFIDLRDRAGILQIVIEPNNQYFNIANEIRHEYVIEVTGVVRARPNPNKELAHGNIEVLATSINILNIASPIPILIDDENTSELNRLSHRIIDLRGKKMQHNLMLRHKLSMQIRNFLDQNNFIDIETPFLTLSTPGGARDFLVPSRMHKGKFYALPQSPQLFKQLLMVAGFDRYYQIVRCFRDEELRADRQPEFTQVDIETSFLSDLDIQAIVEKMIKLAFKNILNVDLGEFPRLTYTDAMFKYGSDKPDLRIPLEFIDLTKELKNAEFKVFSSAANLANGRIVALKLPDNIQFSRKEIDTYNEFVAGFGARGLAYIKINDLNLPNHEGLQSPIIKFLSATDIQAILTKTNAKNGETLFFGADSAKVVNDAIGALRLKIAMDKNLYSKEWAPLWITDFPLFEHVEETNSYTPCHHPFTAPQDGHEDMLLTNPEKCLAKAYDMVLNGSEIGGGSVRIYNAEIQAKVFKAMGITDEEAQAKFGFLLENLQFGAPPHAGIAFGLDRITAIMCKADSIRDVIAFPKTTKGQCLLTNAPNFVDQTQLDELAIKINN